ncbi:uncharacterized protein LOC127002951 [Eriocheir sinensis]|uniref:uncharacterized protein LOC127002951 n=1 Tax=Eriocheir sinensis TaxID=95602 RepID=UPI0021C60D42|nr:uncharacterized protein LOC127002951 [Eriocheir sinensis]
MHTRPCQARPALPGRRAAAAVSFRVYKATRLLDLHTLSVHWSVTDEPPNASPPAQRSLQQFKMNFLRVVAVLVAVLVSVASVTEASPLFGLFSGRRGGHRGGRRGGSNGVNGIVGDAYADVNGDIFPGYPNPLGFLR